MFVFSSLRNVKYYIWDSNDKFWSYEFSDPSTLSTYLSITFIWAFKLQLLVLLWIFYGSHGELHVGGCSRKLLKSRIPKISRK